MTVGEKIQMCRKQHKMSQDELGQKLLVTRQTISLWEKDQTVPTIDNLIRLKEIFNISIDELLDSENEIVAEPTPIEIYRFNFTREELKEIQRSQRKRIYKHPILFSLMCVLLIVFFSFTSAPDIMIGFVFGMFFIGASSHIKTVRAYKKVWKGNMERICNSSYEYLFFEDYLRVNIYRGNEKACEYKCYFSNIEQIQQLGKWFFLQFSGQSFIIRKDDLKENSVFYSYMYNNPSKTTQCPAQNKWRTLSIILFIASILSLFGAIPLILASEVAHQVLAEKFWLFFLFTPIPIASIIFGLVMKAKGYKYKKNTIVGIIMTALLCIYGSFAFVNMYDHSDAPIIKAEQMIGIDIPAHKQIATQDWTKGTQTTPRGYVYTTSYIYFDDSAVAEFEKQLQTDDKWLSSVPNDLIGISSPFEGFSLYDYALIYNTNTSEHNTLPRDNGTFHFISIHYSIENHQMLIVEYDIDYIK